MHGCGGRESQVLADLGGSAAEEEKGRTGGTWFDRIWNPLFAVKDVPFAVCVLYVLRFGFEVLVQVIMSVHVRAQTSVVPRRHGNSMFFIDSMLRLFAIQSVLLDFSHQVIRLQDHILAHLDLLVHVCGEQTSVYAFRRFRTIFHIPRDDQSGPIRPNKCSPRKK
jgi:hypothetical protein